MICHNWYVESQAQQAAEARWQLATTSLAEQQQGLSAQHAQQAQQLMSQVQQLEATCASLTESGAAAEQARIAAVRQAEAVGRNQCLMCFVRLSVAAGRLDELPLDIVSSTHGLDSHLNPYHEERY